MFKKIKITALVAILLSSAGCKKYLDINTNPAVPQVVPAQVLLPRIIFQMANGPSQDYRYVHKITQDLVGISGTSAYVTWEQHGYPDRSDAGGVIWRMNYVDLGINLEDMINDGISNQKYEYAAIGYAIKAWAYQLTTDLHGPIILDEAFMKDSLNFAYQDQPEVYAKVREWANLSLKYFNMQSPIDYSAALRSVTGDGIYGGDKTKWRKFVYGLLAQQYSHLTNKPQFESQYADSVIKYVDLSFSSEAEDATIYFSATSANDSNPYGPQMGYLLSTNSTYWGRQSTQILKYLTGGVRGTPQDDPTTSIDPRLSRMLVPSAVTATQGIYLAATPAEGVDNPVVPHIMGNPPTTTSPYPGNYIFTDKARWPLMTYSQLQLAKAEALFFKGNKGDAHAAYLNGIKGHMDFVNRYGRTSNTAPPAITPSEINAYLASSEVAQTSADLTIADIMGQKYIAQWGWAGLEQWSDIRKYHYDPQVYRNYHQLAAGDIASTNQGKYAYRFRPRFNSEYVWNADELKKWGALDANYMTKELWFSMP